MKKKFGNTWKLCELCVGIKASDVNGPYVCLRCSSVVCLKHTIPVNKEFDRWCWTCVKYYRAALEANASEVNEFYYDPEVANRCIIFDDNEPFQRITRGRLVIHYPKTIPWIINIENALEDDFFKPIQERMTSHWLKHIHKNKNKWNVPSFKKEIIKKFGEDVDDSLYYNVSCKKVIYAMGGSLKKTVSRYIWHSDHPPLINGKRVYPPNVNVLDHKHVSLTEEKFEKAFDIPLSEVGRRIADVVTNNTNIPVGYHSLRWSHELLGNLGQGMNIHKDRGCGENWQQSEIGYLPIVILFHWNVVGGQKFYRMLKNSMAFEVQPNSLVILVGPGAEHLYHEAVIEKLNGCACAWYILSQYRVPDTSALKEIE